MAEPIFYTLSGTCRVIERPRAHPQCRYLAEICVAPDTWGAISGQRLGQSFIDAIFVALANDRFDVCFAPRRAMGGG